MNSKFTDRMQEGEGEGYSGLWLLRLITKWN